MDDWRAHDEWVAAGHCSAQHESQGWCVLPKAHDGPHVPRPPNKDGNGPGED